MPFAAFCCNCSFYCFSYCFLSCVSNLGVRFILQNWQSAKIKLTLRLAKIVVIRPTRSILTNQIVRHILITAGVWILPRWTVNRSISLVKVWRVTYNFCQLMFFSYNLSASVLCLSYFCFRTRESPNWSR